MNDLRAQAAQVVIEESENIAALEAQIAMHVERMAEVIKYLGDAPFTFNGYIVQPVESSTPTVIRIPVDHVGGPSVGSVPFPDMTRRNPPSSFWNHQNIDVPPIELKLPTSLLPDSGPKIGDKVEGMMMPVLGKIGVIERIHGDMYDIQFRGAAGLERMPIHGFTVVT